ncbi:MAG: Fe-S cluster assembly ATPase SufC [Clostridia bacterium]|nr:Fe-S cluster assembly ATPase SufC [Clostridia bacterium]
MAEQFFALENLHVSAGENEIVHGVNLEVRPGEVHVIMGPNGAGKSTIGYAIMGNPEYTVNQGHILFHGEPIEELSADKRARAGIFLSFQNPAEIQGLPMNEMLHQAVEQRRGEKISVWNFNKELKSVMALLRMDTSYAKRDLNFGFSGGEKKKAEIIQMLMLKPELAILDETDSGLDVDAVRTVSEGIHAYMKDKTGSLLIITHSTRILESLKVDYTHVIVNGRLVKTGGPELVEQINQSGFESFLPDQAK